MITFPPVLHYLEFFGGTVHHLKRETGILNYYLAPTSFYILKQDWKNIYNHYFDFEG